LAERRHPGPCAGCPAHGRSISRRAGTNPGDVAGVVSKTVGRGAAGVWVSWMWLFGTPFYWIIAPIVRRLRAVTMADYFEERYGSQAIAGLYTLVAAIVLASGVLFELPVLVYFLSKIGMITPQFLKSYRRHSIVVILLVSAIITPPDIFSQIMVCIPLILLYEISISISRRVNKQREKAMGITSEIKPVEDYPEEQRS